MGLTLGRVFGTEVRAHWTWIPISAFIAVVFGIGLTGDATAWPPALAWAASIACSVLVFGSVVAHELAHVKVARRNGQTVPMVVVQLLGGSYVMEIKAKSAGEELRISLAGSVFSLIVAVVFGAVGALVDFGPLATAPDGVQAIGFVATMVAAFNLMLCVVNLVPGYPMDGARILHAIAWYRTGNEQLATGVAIRIGRYVGIGLIGIGLGSMLFTDQFVGFSLVIAGWLVMNSSKFLDRRTGLQELIAGATVGDAEDADPGRVPPQLTLDVFAGSYLSERSGAAALVERGDELLGIIGSQQIRRIPARSWATTHTEQAMVAIANVPKVSPDLDLWSALEMMERNRLDALIIDGDGRTKLLTRRSAAKLVRDRAEARQRRLGVTPAERKARFRGQR
jgi:Zn-dependent protease/CBS domain-containing protein